MKINLYWLAALGILLLIWLEVGGAERIERWVNVASYTIRNIGVEEEGPAPSPGAGPLEYFPVAPLVLPPSSSPRQ